MSIEGDLSLHLIVRLRTVCKQWADIAEGVMDEKYVIRTLIAALLETAAELTAAGDFSVKGAAALFHELVKVAKKEMQDELESGSDR